MLRDTVSWKRARSWAASWPLLVRKGLLLRVELRVQDVGWLWFWKKHLR